MSVVASAAFINSILYVYYYSPGATFGTVYSLSANVPKATSNSLLISEQSVTGTGTSPINAPSSAWMFPNSKNELILLLNQPSSSFITTLQPQEALVQAVPVIPWNNPCANNFTWTFTDQSQVHSLFPSRVKRLSVASGNNGTPEGSGLYEIYASGQFPVVNKLDISNLATGSVNVVYSARVAGNIDPTSSPRVIRLPSTAGSGADVVAIGKCATSGTCMSFIPDNAEGNVVPSSQPSKVYDSSGCFIATNGLIIMVSSTSGISTFNYAVSSAELLTTNWTTVSKTGPSGAPLSCGINGTQLYVILQGGSKPEILAASMSGSWAWQTQALVTPVSHLPPSAPSTGSPGQSGGSPNSGNGSGDGSNNFTDPSGSHLRSSSTGLGKPVINCHCSCSSRAPGLRPDPLYLVVPPQAPERQGARATDR